MNKKKKYSMIIGRFQPLHAGHIKLIRTVLNEGKNICIALRDTNISDTDPYDDKERFIMCLKEFNKEMADGRLLIVTIPDIEEIVYGRKVGWGIRQIKLDDKTESISATKIRAKRKKK